MACGLDSGFSIAGNNFEGTNSTNLSTGETDAIQVTFTEAGTVEEIHVKAGETGTFRAAIFDNDGSGGSPGTYLGRTAEITCSAGAKWYAGALETPVEVTAKAYWLGIMRSTSSFDVVYYNIVSESMHYDGGNTYPTFPNPFVSGGTWEGNWAMHAAYTAGGGASTYGYANRPLGMNLGLMRGMAKHIN